MIRYSKFTAVQEEKLAKMPQAGMPSQPVWGSRRREACIARTQRPDGRKAVHVLPGKQRASTSTSLIARGGIARERWGDAATPPTLAARGADLRADRTREPPDSKRGENETRDQRDPTSPGGTAPGRRNHPARGGGESLTLASAGAVAAAAAAGRGWSTCIGSAAPAAWAPPGSAAMWRVGLRAETTRKWNLLSLLCPLSPRGGGWGGG